MVSVAVLEGDSALAVVDRPLEEPSEGLQADVGRFRKRLLPVANELPMLAVTRPSGQSANSAASSTSSAQHPLKDQPTRALRAGGELFELYRLKAFDA